MVPPALLPQYSKTHPCVAAKNRDALRELGVASGKSYLKALEAGSMEQGCHMGDILKKKRTVFQK